MKIKQLSILLFTCLLIGFLSCDANKNKNTREVRLSEYKAISNSEKAHCDSSWFPHKQTPAPAEGKGSPFDTSSTTDAIFHEWSWQKFLWLTKRVYSQPLFEKELTWVTSHMEIPKNPHHASVVLTSTDQAFKNAMLLSNINMNRLLDTVYYGIAVDSLLLDSSRSFIQQLKKGNLPASNESTFPVGALEVKTAWIDATTIPVVQQSSYYITNAYVTTTKQTKMVALLGMHVVGVVENHPEFIWATFEHESMAPDYNWIQTKDTITDVPVTSAQNLLFFQKDSMAGVADITYTTPMFKNIFSIFPYGIPKTLNDAIMPNTAQSTKSTLNNLNNIRYLNHCVKKELLKEKSVWSNYFYNGSIWMNTDGLDRAGQVKLIKTTNYNNNAVAESPMRGSLAAFNITMETFAQQFKQQKICTMKAKNLVNCFSCHTSTDFSIDNANSPLYLSHIFQGALALEKGQVKEEIEQQRIKEAIEAMSSHE
ncbi:MAG: hypothetical protein ACJAUV_000545 [Flavobacteriales bacterium]|jgi:hypothetical protein